MALTFTIQTEREADGRWIAEVIEVPGATAHGASRDSALAQAQALALRALVERLENGEPAHESASVSFHAVSRARADASRASDDRPLRPFGLCAGEFTVPDDFDDPLPEHVLREFEGRE